MNNEAIELAKSVIDWWEINRFQEIPLGDGEFDNFWDETPEFVTKAQKIVPDYTPTITEE